MTISANRREFLGAAGALVITFDITDPALAQQPQAPRLPGDLNLEIGRAHV